MSDLSSKNVAANTWIVIDGEALRGEFSYFEFILELSDERHLFSSVSEGDWMLISSQPTVSAHGKQSKFCCKAVLAREEIDSWSTSNFSEVTMFE